MREAVIVEAVRTSMIKKKGIFSRLQPEQLASEVIKALINRSGVAADLVEDIIIGCSSKSDEQVAQLVKLAMLNSGIPTSVPSTTVERHCKSSQQAIHFAAQAIISGDMDIMIAAGLESIEQHGKPQFNNRKKEKGHFKHQLLEQGLAAERIADIWGLSRQQLDEYAYESHEKAIQAQSQNRFEKEIVPLYVTLPNGKKTLIQKDVGPRKALRDNMFSKLKATYKENGKVHSGNSSFFSDGSAAVLIMSNTKANELGLKPRYKIINRSVVRSDPKILFTGLIIGTNKALTKAGLRIEDIDVFEISEVFASVPLIWLQETGADPKKVNPNGGAIALGHPLGANGTRLLTTLIHELERTGGNYGLLGQCEGHGIANITIIERVNE
ncbi:thiolase family protein [Alkalihalobacterium elongatum]|uniref:thiolase family protein n=1 Tax=Alkalihalobacterium elongatum TaxID=2675466 RepID=UPI001C1F39B7|nr:thiolase family protein [Alkalihalobacterium elongatum]